MITAIDLFSGAGGMSQGATMAGVNTIIAIEADKFAAQTYAHNHSSTRVITSDIRSIDDSTFTRNGNQKILFGGPPCQGFSTSNQKTRNSLNLNNWLFLEFLRVTKACKPEWIILENVPGLIETGKGFFLKEIINQFSEIGYTCTWWILNAADYGVPQSRRRLFIIGSLNGIKPPPPPRVLRKKISVKEAIGDLPILSNGDSHEWLPYDTKAISEYAIMMRSKSHGTTNHLVTRNSDLIVERYRHIPQGGNWKSIPDYLMSNYKDHSRCHSGIYKRLKNDDVSVVIGNYRKNMLIHPSQNRGLSVREAARIQSFPDSYEFKGSIGYQQQQVGNAVPPLLAKSVFQTIINY